MIKRQKQLMKLTIDTRGFIDLDPVTKQPTGTYRSGLPNLDRDFVAFEKIIQSATNQIQYFGDSLKSVDPKSGLAQGSIYFDPTAEKNVIANVKNLVEQIANRKINAGRYGVSTELVDVMETSRKIYGTRAQKKAIEEILARGGEATVNANNSNILDITLPVPQGQSKKDSSKYLTSIIQQAMKYSNAERDKRKQEARERQEKEDRKREEKEDRKREANAERDKRKQEARERQEKVARERQEKEDRKREAIAERDKRKQEARERQEKEARERQEKEDRERQEKEDRKREAKADMEFKRTTHKLIMGAIGVLTLISNLMRRLVTASFAQATADAIRARQAHDLQLTAGEVRQYEVAERVHGLTSGTILGGAQAFQNAFGNTSSLNQKKIDQLAYVLGEDVANDIRSGLPSGKRPADLMQEALTAALARYEAGQDYLGNKMGSKEEARRSLVTWAESIDENFATILSQMIEDKTRGDYNFADFNSWLTSAQAGQTVTSRITDIEENAIQSFTRNLNLATNNLQDMAEKIKINVALALDGLVSKVANIDFGKTDKQKFETEAQRIKYVNKNLPLMQQQMLEAEQYVTNFLGEEFTASIKDIGDLIDIPNGALASTDKINAARKKVFADPQALVALATYKTMKDKSQYYQDAINSGKIMKKFNASDFDFAMQMLAIEDVLNDLLTKGATTSIGLRGTANITGSSLDYRLTSGNVTFRELNDFEKDIAKKALKELRVLTGENSTLGLLESNDDLAEAVAKAKKYKNKEALINAYKQAQGYQKASMITEEDLINALLSTADSPKSYSNIAIGKTIEDYKDELVKQGLTNLMLSRYSSVNASDVYKQAIASGQYSYVQAQMQKGDGTIKIVMYGVDAKGKQYQLLETQAIGYDYSGENFTIDAADIFSQD